MPTILVLEPEGPAREPLLQLLRGAGHQVSVVESHDEAIAAWRQDRHDLAILALDAPGALTGAEVASRMKSETPHIFAPVVLIVPPAPGEQASVEARIAALAVGDDVVSRPYWPVEILARAEALLRIRHLVDGLRASRADLESRAAYDGTTGLRARPFLLERLNEEWKRAVRYNEPLTFLVLAVEELETIQARRGTPLADRVLSAVAQATLRSLRQIDIVARWGRGEVAAVLPNTHFVGALVCAERIAREVSGGAVEDLRPRVSMGISFYPGRDVTGPSDLLALAGRALERARAEGPGAVCLVQHQGYLFFPDAGSGRVG